MSIFSAFAKKPAPAHKTPSLTAVELPESSFSLRNTLEPNDILNAKTYKDLGQYKPIMRCYRIFREEDDSVASASDVRAEALKAALVSFETEGLSQVQLNYFDALIKRFGALYCDMLLDYKFHGLLFRQIAYDIENGLYTPQDYLEYPNADIRLVKKQLLPFDSGKPIPINELQFIALTRKSGAYFSILRYNVFFSFAINNWAQFTETFGKPPRIAKYKPGTTEAEKNQLWQMLQNFGTDMAAMVSENVVIDFADFVNKNANADLYRTLCDFCDDRITRRILGNTLTTKAVSTGGSYAQASVHELVRSDILAGDCRDLDIFLTGHFNMLNRINFGTGQINVTVKPAQKVDLLQRIQIDEKLWNSIGIDFPEDYWHQTYGVPHPDKR
jgi:hypothetical protein